MRYTVKNPAHRGARVFLDGDEVEHVTECDTTEGWVQRFKKGPDGKPYLNESLTAVEEERLFGSVVVALRDEERRP